MRSFRKRGTSPSTIDPATAAAARRTARAAYAADQARVDAAFERMCAVLVERHLPAEARRVAAELSMALREATATANRAMRLDETATPRRGLLPHRRATDDLPVLARPWSAEIARLSAMVVWLRRQTLNDPGVRVPTTVQIGSRAASGPHIAGLVAEPASLIAETLSEPRIGVDERAVVDGAPSHGAPSHCAPGDRAPGGSAPGHSARVPEPRLPQPVAVATPVAA